MPPKLTGALEIPPVAQPTLKPLRSHGSGLRWETNMSRCGPTSGKIQQLGASYSWISPSTSRMPTTRRRVGIRHNHCNGFERDSTPNGVMGPMRR